MIFQSKFGVQCCTSVIIIFKFSGYVHGNLIPLSQTHTYIQQNSNICQNAISFPSKFYSVKLVQENTKAVVKNLQEFTILTFYRVNLYALYLTVQFCIVMKLMPLLPKSQQYVISNLPAT